MKETENRRPVLQRSAKSTDARTSGSGKQDGSAAGQLARMQAAAGNQAVLQRYRDDIAAERGSGGQTAASASGNGASMPPEIQAKMEHAMNADFSDVNIHTGPQASAVGALAYTQGTDIHFAPGQYKPDSPAGQKLLGHELAHVVQQKEGRVSPTARLATGQQLNDNPALEREADMLGAKAASASVPETSPIQRSASAGGESSAARPVIQRMPRPAEVRSKLGEPKEHVKNPFQNRFTKKLGMSDHLKHNSTHYRAFLQKLENFDRYVDGEIVGDTPDVIGNQLNHVMTLYEEVEQVSNAYIKHNGSEKRDPKVVYIKSLKETLPFEKKAVRSAAAEYKLDLAKERPNWKLLTSTSVLQLNDEMSTGATGKGGINTVSFFEIGPNVEGVFKSDKEQLRKEEEMPAEASDKEKDAAGVEYMFATIDAGINPADAHMASRNVAMHRLDKLLNAGVIARAEFALYNSGEGIVKGSYMDKAKGKSADKMLNPLLDEIEAGQDESFDVNDPAFQQAMSRLQLIDTLAMQVDRHVGNFFIHRDEFGNLLSVTGIDNDMAFGEQTDLDMKHKEYPGLSKLVDKELAERIIALRPDELRMIMEDLLSPAELDALIDRLIKLQTHLKKETTRLLEKDEWSEVHESIRKGDKSYAAGIDIPISYSRAKAERNRKN